MTMLRNNVGNTARFLALATILSLAPGCGSEAQPDLETEAAKLRALHDQMLAAHRNGDVESWMSVEAEEITVAGRGEISFPSAADRRARRETYLGSTTFSVYRDMREPIVQVSDDATLGWLIAEVEIEGVRTIDGTDVPFHSIWAWIETYEKQAGEWKMVGNVSNLRPEEDS
jgi:hypothetical protein